MVELWLSLLENIHLQIFKALIECKQSSHKFWIKFIATCFKEPSIKASAMVQQPLSVLIHRDFDPINQPWTKTFTDAYSAPKVSFAPALPIYIFHSLLSKYVSAKQKKKSDTQKQKIARTDTRILTANIKQRLKKKKSHFAMKLIAETLTSKTEHHFHKNEAIRATNSIRKPTQVRSFF